LENETIVDSADPSLDHVNDEFTNNLPAMEKQPEAA